MSPDGRPPLHVPTLTEVIDLLPPAPVRESGMPSGMPTPLPQADGAPIITADLPSAAQLSDWTPMHTVVLEVLDQRDLPPMVVQDLAPVRTAPPLMTEAAGLLPLSDVTEAQMLQRVLGDVQKQIDGLVDFRLREAIAPILARHSDALVRDLREELGRTLRDVVARSVAQELAKLRQR